MDWLFFTYFPMSLVAASVFFCVSVSDLTLYKCLNYCYISFQEQYVFFLFVKFYDNVTQQAQQANSRMLRFTITLNSNIHTQINT